MALQFSVAVRNAMLEAIEEVIGSAAILEIRTGAPPVNCAAADSGTLLASITLASDWSPAASNGSKAWAVPISDLDADAAGVAAHYRLKSSGGICHAQGTVTATGGGGDLTLDSVNIVLHQTLTITNWNWTMAGA